VDRLYFVIGQIKIAAQEGSGKQPAEAGRNGRAH
jgi:hypothetical protein